MKAIEYQAPRSLDEALAVFSERKGRARALAGGTDLIVQLREDRADCDIVVDVKKIPELNELTLAGDGSLTIGAAVPCCEIYENGAVAEAFPCIIDAVSLIGGIQIQNRASLGGNLCNASPAADGIPPLIVHEAICSIAGPRGLRSVPVEEFCTAPGKTVLQSDEFLVGVRIPAPPKRFSARYLRFIPRNEMDIAVAGAASALELEEDLQTIRHARIALAAVAPTPIVAEDAQASLVGQAATEENFEKAAELARKIAKPISDMRGQEWQRVHLTGVLTRRTLRDAFERARKN